MGSKLTKAQRAALSRVETWADCGVYMPYQGENRTFVACEKRGLLEYVSVSDGAKYNGFRLTPAGRSALEAEKQG